MIREAEDFAAEDEATWKHMEALNGLSSFIYGLETQTLTGPQEKLTCVGGVFPRKAHQITLSRG